MQKENVFLLALHFSAKDIIREFRKIREAAQVTGDSFLLYHQKGNERVSRRIQGEPHYIVTDAMLSEIGYAPYTGSLVPGCSIFLLIQFFRQHKYKNYWFIEYDVRFTGDWKLFFSHFDKRDEDFLAGHIRRYSQEPQWRWWQTLSNPSEFIELSKCLRCFCPIYRISWAALKYIDQMYMKQWSGHEEVVLPSLLYRGGFKLGDFGGTGEFVAAEDKNRFYIDSTTPMLLDGTLRFLQPFLFLFNKPRNMLCHPFKSWRKITLLKRLFTKTFLYGLLYRPLKNFLNQPFQNK